MPQFLIERTVPGASLLSREELQKISQKSVCAMKSLNTEYRWLRTYILGDKFMCVHEARDEATVREHAMRGGFPITRVTQIDGVFGPQTADAPESAVVSG